MAEEPSVLRVWLPDQDSPGLAMARAFGDFCLKDFGLISTPDVTHRKLCDKDEFVVLATDGVSKSKCKLFVQEFDFVICCVTNIYRLPLPNCLQNLSAT